jgi:Family of unknown function (DUF6375)
MKIWNGYGSEHSMNLVMIGRFEKEEDAARVKEIIDGLTKQVRSDEEAGYIKIGSPVDRYTDSMLDLLSKMNVSIIGPTEVEQFAYEFKIKRDGSQIVITTEESEISALFKVLVSKGARVEVFSAHDYPETGYGRGK